MTASCQIRTWSFSCQNSKKTLAKMTVAEVLRQAFGKTSTSSINE